MAARVSYCLVCRDRRDEWKETGLARGRVFDALKHSWQYRELVKDRKLFTEDQRQDVIAWLSHYNLYGTYTICKSVNHPGFYGLQINEEVPGNTGGLFSRPYCFNNARGILLPFP